MPNAQELNEAADDLDWLLHPPYWFVHALPWPGGYLAEGAIACAPITIPRDGLSRDAQQILACADLIADRCHERVVFFGDITRLLARGGASWNLFDIDWEHGLQELASGHFPALYLTITENAYAHICLAASPVLNVSAYGSQQARDEDERRNVRRSLAQRLETDWSSLAQEMVTWSRA